MGTQLLLWLLEWQSKVSNEQGIDTCIFQRAVYCLQDYANIQEECYKLPWDMTTQGHRQFSLTYILGKASLFITETLHVLDRRDAGKPDPVWMVSGLYPDYFLNTFHYQVGVQPIMMQLVTNEGTNIMCVFQTPPFTKACASSATRQN